MKEGRWKWSQLLLQLLFRLFLKSALIQPQEKIKWRKKKKGKKRRQFAHTCKAAEMFDIQHKPGLKALSESHQTLPLLTTVTTINCNQFNYPNFKLCTPYPMFKIDSSKTDKSLLKAKEYFVGFFYLLVRLQMQRPPCSCISDCPHELNRHQIKPDCVTEKTLD